MAKLFLSYAREDQKLIEPIAHLLEGAGHSVWWDRRIFGGSDFSLEIARELDSAEVVIVGWSAASVASHWVKDEAAEGRNRNRLVPLFLDGTPPPLGFRQIHGIDFTGWDGRGSPAALDDLLRSIALVAGSAEWAPPASTPAAPAPLPSASARPTWRTPILVIGSVLLLAVAALLVLALAPRWSRDAPPTDAAPADAPAAEAGSDSGHRDGHACPDRCEGWQRRRYRRTLADLLEHQWEPLSRNADRKRCQCPHRARRGDGDGPAVGAAGLHDRRRRADPDHLPQRRGPRRAPGLHGGQLHARSGAATSSAAPPPTRSACSAPRSPPGGNDPDLGEAQLTSPVIARTRRKPGDEAIQSRPLDCFALLALTNAERHLGDKTSAVLRALAFIAVCEPLV